MTSAATAVHPAFELIRHQSIATLKVEVEEYRHRATGAQHIHIASTNPENVFLVALRTVPHDSTGVAHILEHTALCGSKKYPVRDPFFMMLRRSLNTFMNAFTSSDWTAYPFASQNRKDFSNLLDVYLDAVFFAKLDALDFAQEGHRVEFATPGDTSSPLVFKGVVFNEMKGAMSSVTSTLWQTLTQYIWPTTTYHYNSGGDPAHIPDLTYSQLQDFYRTHYHPSNAIFMTYGDIAAAEHQARFETQVMSQFTPLDHQISVPSEKRLLTPLRVEETYALEPGESTEAKTHVVLGWLLGDAADLHTLMRAHLLTAVLLDNSASPLQQALESTDLGKAPSPLCGMEDSQKELLFAAGLEGTEVCKADDIEALILTVLERVATEGIAQERLEACLHQLELQQREVGGGSYPYGLQLILTALNSATHRGNPVDLLDLDPVLASLRESIRDPDFIRGLVREFLLDNPHRVRLVLRPDTTLAARCDAAEAARLAQLKATLTPAQQQEIVELAQALEARQRHQDDPDVLPRVELSDVPVSLLIPEPKTETLHTAPLAVFSAGTNGLLYQQIIVDLPSFDATQLPYLSLFASMLSEVGVGARDYLAVQDWQSAVCGGIGASISVRGGIDNEQQVRGHLILGTKALSRNSAAVSELMQATLEEAHFDEPARLRELIAQYRARAEQSVTGNGHVLAMNAASAGMSPGAYLQHTWSGLAGVAHLKNIDQLFDDAQALEQFCATLREIQQRIAQAPRQFLLIGDEPRLSDYRADLAARWSSATTTNNTAGSFTSPPLRNKVNELWQTGTRVHFCARAYPTVPMHHADAPALTVLGGFLRNGYLHRAIREQGGAYGGGASQENNIAAFRFYSYRDPRLTETLQDFDASIAWLQSETHDARQVEEAILGVISSIDKPSSPAGDAKIAFHNSLYGRTPDVQRDYRARILKVSLQDLQRVGAQYLTASNASTAVITHSGQEEIAQSLGLEVKTL